MQKVFYCNVQFPTEGENCMKPEALVRELFIEIEVR